MMSNSVNNLNTALNSFNLSVKAKLQVAPTTAALADNSAKLGGKTLTELVTDVDGVVTAHINNKNNPHGLTASQLNAFTKEEIVAMFSNYVPPNTVPISFFGNTETNLVQSINTSALTVSLISDIPAMVAGRYVKMSGFSFNCTPNGKTWLYIGLNQLTLAYSTSFGEMPLSETQSKMLIGCVTTQNGAIVSHWVKPMRRIDITPVPRVPDLTNRKRVCSLGYMQTLYATGESGFWEGINKLISARRGYHVLVIDPNTKYVQYADIFDTYLGTAEIDRMTTYLNNILPSMLVLVFSYDEATSGGVATNTAWVNAMYGLGAPSNFQTQLKVRGAHVLLGKKGSAQGSAYNFVGGAVDNASDAVVDVNFYISNGSFTDVQRTI